MTLLNTNELIYLYKEAHKTHESRNGDRVHFEKHCRDFFSHLFRLQFAGTFFMFHPEREASSRDPDRRVDFSIRYLPPGRPEAVVLIFNEAKKVGSGPDELEEVENQLFTACFGYLKDSGQPYVYGASTIGTAIRLWKFDRMTPQGTQGAVALFGETQFRRFDLYQDVNAADTTEITRAFATIRAYPPSPFPSEADSGQVKVSFTPASSSQVQVPVAAATTAFTPASASSSSSSSTSTSATIAAATPADQNAASIQAWREHYGRLGYRQVFSDKGTEYWKDYHGKRTSHCLC